MNEQFKELRLERVSRHFGHPGGAQIAALHELTLTIRRGEFICLLGPSGCGKTTALNCIAGLLPVTGGTISLDERRIDLLPPEKRGFGMVFQNYALFPHMTVRRNVAFGLQMRRVPAAEMKARVARAFDLVQLTGHEDKLPGQLSGGQQQRVAIARAIVIEPPLLLMDEPLSNLDAKLRVQMRAEIARIQQALKVTTVYVTHDQVEAMTMGNRVAVMRDGLLQQVDTPQRLYDAPVNLFVASFVGSPAMNLFEAGLESDDGKLVCRIGDTDLELPSDLAGERPSLANYAGRRVAVGIRPEDIREAAGWDGTRLRGRILLVESLGSEQLVHIEITAAPLERSDLVDTAAQLPGPSLGVDDSERSVTLLGRFDRHLLLAPGEVVEVAIDPRLLHFFDLETGAAISRVDVPVATPVAR